MLVRGDGSQDCLNYRTLRRQTTATEGSLLIPSKLVYDKNSLGLLSNQWTVPPHDLWAGGSSLRTSQYNPSWRTASMN